MLQCLRKSVLKNCKKSTIRQHAESYHSYPDPTEVPEVSSTVSSFKKTFDKSSGGFSIDEKFRLDRSFTSTQTRSAPGNRSRPEPASTTISNGIVVSSIDTPGLMTSFSFLVQTGRWYIVSFHRLPSPEFSWSKREKANSYLIGTKMQRFWSAAGGRFKYWSSSNTGTLCIPKHTV